MDELNNRVFMLLEFGEIDLATILKRNEGGCLRDEAMIRSYYLQMLKGVDCIHKERIVHGDLKPANFLLVKGVLKLIDFGIAKRIEGDETTNIYRDTQIGTLNYMSPEAILEHKECDNAPEYKISRCADIWSLGCILHQMCFGFTPFSQLPTVAKICAITNPQQKIAITKHPTNHVLNWIIEQSLNRDPKQRPTLEELLHHSFVTLNSHSLQISHLSQFFETAKIPIPQSAQALFAEFCQRVNTGSQNFDLSSFLCENK